MTNLEIHIKSQGRSSKTPNIEFFTADIGLWFPQRFLRCSRSGYLSNWSYWRFVSYVHTECCSSAAWHSWQLSRDVWRGVCSPSHRCSAAACITSSAELNTLLTGEIIRGVSLKQDHHKTGPECLLTSWPAERSATVSCWSFATHLHDSRVHNTARRGHRLNLGIFFQSVDIIMWQYHKSIQFCVKSMISIIEIPLIKFSNFDVHTYIL